ncbi:MAG: TRAP transporter small permease [Lentisphaerae bacterium]|nr:TRAP transporter small permease [Lentisphaerota bacterium]
MRAFRKLIAAWSVAEEAALAVLVVGMVGLSGAQIVLRNVFKTGIPWIEPALGNSLLWITMLGALAATGARKHISIDLATHFVPARPKAALRAVTDGFAAAVCGFLARASWRYVTFMKEAGDAAFPGVPAWAAYAVMPAVFALIAARLLARAALALAEAARGAGAPPAPAPDSLSPANGAKPDGRADA